MIDTHSNTEAEIFSPPASAIPREPNPNAANLNWSREQALEQIAQAQSLEELFDVANRAMGPQRQAWGDSFDDAAHSAYLWANSSFTIAAQESADFQTYFGRVNKASGPAMEAYALDSAKAFAHALLQPQDSFEQRIGYVVSKLPEQLREINDRHSLIKNGLGGAEKPDLIATFVGPQVLVALSSETAMDAAVRSRLQSWGDIDQFLNPDLGALTQSVETEDIFRQTIDEFGMSRIGVGPIGGMNAARHRAREIHGALRDMASYIKVPSQGMGLGGVAIEVNQLFADDTAASYNSAVHQISTGQKTEHLGHEWTHAAEHWIDSVAQPSDLKQALSKLRHRVNNLDPNISAIENQKAFLADEGRKLTQTIVSRLETDGSLLVRIAARRGKLPPAVAHALTDGREPFHSVEYSAERLASAFNRCLSRKATRMPVDEAKKIIQEYRAGYQRYMFYDQMAKDGQSMFVALAKDLDKVRKTHYFSKPTELLARASEPYFMEIGNPAVSQAGAGRVTIPHGPEREQTNKAFQDFMSAFAQHMHSQYPSHITPANSQTDVERVSFPTIESASQAPLPPAEERPAPIAVSLPEPGGMSCRLAAWRSGRQPGGDTLVPNQPSFGRSIRV